ncbi:hypothetical protein NHX12_003307 [Muraenolepis orangiensis]|uniref:Anoctamin n=1 Tax=Muraenolepis orangiensis TaxID=630683 RepID=A0A9Q0IE09_9TELE|nr:hypothetical protein NHX12_003307 [Muraenolepis orangiensis]
MHVHRRQPSIELLELMGVVKENGGDYPSIAPVHMYDYVLVGKIIEDQHKETYKKQLAFIEELKRKNFKVTKILNDDIIFYGIQAPREIFDRYRYLLKVSDACSWSSNHKVMPIRTRIRIVHFILNNTPINTGEDLRDLLKKKVFEARFCLHEKKKQRELRQNWARWTACFQGQPITAVRSYFGEKVALYYLWLGWYTYLLIPAAIIGLVVFLYGLMFFNSSPLIKEVCESTAIMCPLCDKRCKVWQLSDTCTYTKLSLLFDNVGTVIFAMFMAVWATLFLEFWKRHRASYVCEWKVSDWNEEEEELILEIVNNPNCVPKQYKHSYLRSTLVLICVTLMIMVIIGLTHALVVFRVMAAVMMAEGSWEFLSDHSNLGAMVLGAFLHYLIITVMTRINRIVARKLCDIEETRSFAATEKSFTVKMFTFQFFTYFSSLFYVAFFLGRINGHPGRYVRIAGKWRLEECHPSGCLTDLFIQMAIIMILKQTISNVFEFTVPWFHRWLKRRRMQKLQRKCAHCYLKDDYESSAAELCENCKLRDWLSNYRLNDVNSFSLFNEFLEMVIQFSFTTIFVAAFPLAPLLALINNIIEIRLDAIKMVNLERRMVPKKTNDIGIWTEVLEAIGVLAVIANGLVIGISSDFIPRMVYMYRYGPCANGNATDIDCMVGYINNTLSIAHMTDQDIRNEFLPSQMITHSGVNVSSCSYKDYRSDGDSSFTPQFWLILAVRFAFVILFEHVVVVCKFVAAWFVPSAPIQVKNDRLFDKFNRLKEENRTTREACVDGERFEERVVYVREKTGYRLKCPLDRTDVTWLKNCHELPPLSLSGDSDPSPGLFLEFSTLGPKDMGNYTCTVSNTTASFTVHLIVREAQCSKAPEFKPSGDPTNLWGHLVSVVTLNCTALVHWDPDEEPFCASPSLQSGHHVILSALLEVPLQKQEDFGLYSCSVRNTSVAFNVQNTDRPSHTAAVIAAVVLLLLLSLAVFVYSKYHLNFKLWYRNLYGDYELNDGKLYDGYISYVNNECDRKFVNFILKPNLAKHGQKMHLNEKDILPGAEPSAELLMNVSRSRRLVVVLSHAYLEQDWCCNNFRQGLLHLLELSQKPIIITLEGQMKCARPEVMKELREHQHRLTMLTWRHNSVNPSSVFWKELVLAMPRRVVFHCESAGDPQTMWQDDKDPMLTLDPDYLDCRSETDPDGDLGTGLHLPVYKASRVPVLQAITMAPAEPKLSDIDVSDLGSRNYGARTDFYCLVTKEDM